MATELTITPDFVDKTATLVGVVAVGEQVALTVVGVGGGIAGLRVRLRYAGVEVARFPLEEADAFTAPGAGTDAVGTIDLNTVELRAAFDGLDDNAKLACTLIVEFNGTDDNLYALTRIQVRNWPAIPADQVPVSVATWVDDLAAAQAAIDALEVAVPLGAFKAHTHADAGEGGVVDHDDLSGTGTNSHAQIDATLSSLSGAMNLYAGVVAAHKADTANPHSVTKVQVGLGDVDDTSDADKPISTATQAALDRKIEASHLAEHTGRTDNPHSVTAAQLGLGSVDNTADSAKPLSTAMIEALSNKVSTATLLAHTTRVDDPHDTIGVFQEMLSEISTARPATVEKLKDAFVELVKTLKGIPI